MPSFITLFVAPSRARRSKLKVLRLQDATNNCLNFALKRKIEELSQRTLPTTTPTKSVSSKQQSIKLSPAITLDFFARNNQRKSLGKLTFKLGGAKSMNNVPLGVPGSHLTDVFCPPTQARSNTSINVPNYIPTSIQPYKKPGDILNLIPHSNDSYIKVEVADLPEELVKYSVHHHEVGNFLSNTNYGDKMQFKRDAVYGGVWTHRTCNPDSNPEHLRQEFSCNLAKPTEVSSQERRTRRSDLVRKRTRHSTHPPEQEPTLDEAYQLQAQRMLEFLQPNTDGDAMRRFTNAQRMRDLRQQRRLQETDEETRLRRSAAAQRMRSHRQEQRQESSKDALRRFANAQRMRELRQQRRLQETEDEARQRRAIAAQRMRTLRQLQRAQETAEEASQRLATHAAKMREFRRLRRLQKKNEEQSSTVKNTYEDHLRVYFDMFQRNGGNEGCTT